MLIVSAVLAVSQGIEPIAEAVITEKKQGEAQKEPIADELAIPEHEALRTFDALAPALAAPPTTKTTRSTYKKGQLIVKFKPSLTQCAHCLLERGQSFASALEDTSDSLDRLHQQCQVRGARSVFRHRCGHTTHEARLEQHQDVELHRHAAHANARRAPRDAEPPDLTNVYVLEVPDDADVEEIAKRYAADPHVEYAQPNYLAETFLVPNDPYFLSRGSWGQSYEDLWGLKKLRTEQAWDKSQGEGVVVAVVDTGVDYLHPDIAANIWTNPGEVPGNGRDDDANGFIDDVHGWDFVSFDDGKEDADPMDDHGHGTHVAGTIAAVGNNSLGIIGVAPKAKIMAIKGLDHEGSGTFEGLAKGIVYAAQNGADVLNNSWGCGTCPSVPIAEDAVRTAYALGSVVVFAAGNSADDVAVRSPQNMTNPKPVVVAASTELDQPTYFTSFGYLVDVAAPGGGTPLHQSAVYNILSLRASACAGGGMCTPDLIVGTDYLRLAGTSMATPHAVGVAALVLAHQPTLTPDEVRQVLRLSADDIGQPGFDPKTGAGRLNAARALDSDTPGQTLTVQITNPKSGNPIHPKVGSVTITGTATGPNLKKWELFYGAGEAPAEWIRLAGPSSTPVENEELATWNLQGLPYQAYILKLVATSTQGLEFPSFVTVGILPLRQITKAPTIPSGARISSNRIVWHDWRHANLLRCQEGSCNSEIYLYDLTTNTERRITNDTYWQILPRIAGDKIIWVDYRTGYADIYLYDLTTHTERRITHESSPYIPNFYPPAFDGDLIAWPDVNPQHGYFDLYLHSLVTGAGRWLGYGTWQQSEPAIDGNRVVWRDNRHYYEPLSGNLEIYLYDVAAQSERRLTTNPKYQMYPDVSGDRVVWQDWRNTPNGTSLTDIYLFDLAKDEERRLTPYFMERGAPVIDGDRMIWMEETEEHHPAFGDAHLQHIFLYEFNLAPELEPIGNQAVEPGQELSFRVSASDVDGDPLTYRVSGLPPGAVFADQTFSWTPHEAGIAEVTFLVSDGHFEDQETISIVVNPLERMPELVLTQLSAIGTAAVPGATVTARFALTNLGYISTPVSRTAFALSRDAGYGGPDDIALVPILPTGGLAAGRAVSGAVRLTVPAATPLGDYYLCASADSTHAVSEATETNNGRCTPAPIRVTRPDLVISTLGPAVQAVKPGATLVVRNTVFNQAAVPAGAALMDFHLSTNPLYGDADDVALVAKRGVGALTGYVSQAASTTLVIPASVPVGSYYLCAKVDALDRVPESNETNNPRCAASTIQITYPDLVVELPRGGGVPPTGKRGTRIYVLSGVQNRGLVGCGGSTLGVYLSTDATITLSDRLMARVAIPPLGAAGGAPDIVIPVTIPATLAPGPYHLGFIADPLHQVTETDETNNARVGNPITIE